MKSIVIAGAGVIGLATALELAGRGHRVQVLEQGRVLGEASRAAAGMLAGSDPENPAGLAPLAQLSLSLYPEFLARLEKLSDLAVPIHTHRTLQWINLEAAGRNAPEYFAEREMIEPIRVEQIRGHEEIAERVPGVRFRPDETALWIREQSVDPREMCVALTAAVKAAGIEVHEHTPVVSVRAQGGRLSVDTSNGKLTADDVVVATGAWAAQQRPLKSLEALPAGSVVPRKGQMLRVRAPACPRLTTVLRSSEIYIVPRKDGSLVIGATVENSGFDRTVRDEATLWLLQRAAELWTPLAGLGVDQIEEVWTGIRPGTPDHLPILGRMDHPHLWFATGHYRNGILLAPATALVMADLVCGELPAVSLRLFDPKRFEDRTRNAREPDAIGTRT